LERITNFYDLKERLVREGKTFDREVMKQLEYQDLILCAIGDAGKARCATTTVLEEAAERRSVYNTLSLQRVQELREVLELEGMYEEVLADAVNRSPDLLSYKKLTDTQRLYFKLRCLRNHQDYPHKRVEEALWLVDKIQKLNPSPEISKWQTTLEALEIDNAANLGPVHFRKCLQGVRDLFKLMSLQEVAECEAETLRDYSCTHNCFAPVV